MSTWDAPQRRLTIWGGSQRLASLFGCLAGANALAVLWLPAALGYPTGGVFLLEALPLFAAAAFVGAFAVPPIVLARRIRVGLGACATFSGALVMLGTANAYLWVLCVASV